ncbi:MAG: chromosome segregation SMC family protein [Pseudomonadota bacterium]|nr:chromosome segregation SMC family protein [Pseudomonadota bacterium]
MRLKHISLSGFKSFVDPTRIPFPSDMSAVVGPNGCGKSNIIDAVRWVLGEGSAKNLRGDSMSDVIFNGSVARPASSRASVELVFDNSSGRLGGEYSSYSEISVKRQVDHEGLSSYYLNGSSCRRKDITDIFLGTGLGPRSYAVIEQEMATKLISSKPEELRSHIEEVAGISVYKERRKETESRIKKTKENLDRVNDLKKEIDRNLLKLKQQIKSAEKYDLAKQNLKKFRSLKLASNWLASSEKVKEMELNQKRQEIEIQKKISEKEKINTQIEETRNNQSNLLLQIEKMQESFYSSGAEISKSEQELISLEEKVVLTNNEIESINQKIIALDSNINSEKNAIEQIRTSLEKETNALEEAKNDFERLQISSSPEEFLDKLLNDIGNLIIKIKNLSESANFDNELREVLSDSTNIQSGLSRYKAEFKNISDAEKGVLNEKREKYTKAIQEVANKNLEISKLEGAIHSKQKEIETFQSKTKELSESRESLMIPINEIKEEIKPLLDKRSGNQNELTALRNNFERTNEEIRTLEKNLNIGEIKIEELKSLSNSSVVEKQKFITEAEILQKQIQSEYGELQTVLDKLEPEFDLAFIENEIERFNKQIESIGPINLAAKEEFKIEEERNQEIESQLNELNKAIETLQSAIKKIDQESRTKFQDTLDSVNSEIAKLFPKLFGGGHAKLELTGEDVLESGVVLKAMPPGKKNVSVSQLSGGEKAMSAIAMVFSFFSLNPSPFCILDEIDAPLDDLNTFRYISMVEEMSKKIQFIYITHNKISMEKSKHLMGITMEEAGVSRLVSVDVEEALSLAVNE